MDIKIPIKRSSIYTQPYSLKVESELKNNLEFLESQKVNGTDKKIDVPELVREAMREAVKGAFKKLGIDRAS